MTTVLATTDDLPELRAALDRRRELGLDLYDEVWEGVYRIVNAPGPRHAAAQGVVLEVLGPLASAHGLRALGPANIGVPDDHRIPDACVVERSVIGAGAWLERALIVVEILSSGEPSRAKVDFYATCGVAEYLEINADVSVAELWALRADAASRIIHRSDVLPGLDLEALRARLSR